MYEKSNESNVYPPSPRLPDAVAVVKGGAENRAISGSVELYQAKGGVLVMAEISGLPSGKGPFQSNIFAFHIHGGGECTGGGDDPFSNAGTHYDPHHRKHPYHAGDMPPLFGAGGKAFLAFLTDRFTIGEIIGKTVVIHDSPDDFTTQPAGNAGKKIACGVIGAVKR